MQPFEFRVIRHRELTSKVYELVIEGDRPFSFRAGQWVSLVIPGADNGRDLRRAYSIASAPEASALELCIERVAGGPGSNYLDQLKAGDRVTGYGPYGHLVYKTTPDRHAFFISTGTGIAPFRSILLSKEFAASPPLSASCLLGVRRDEDLLYADELGRLENVKWVPCLSKLDKNEVSRLGKSAFSGRVTHCLLGETLSLDWSTTDFYLCGNGAMIDEVRALLLARGVGKRAIYFEAYFRPTDGSR